MLPEDWQNLQRVLVIQLGSLEDVRLTAPALRKLRQLLPDVAIVLMTSLSVTQLATETHWVDEFIYAVDAKTHLDTSLQSLIVKLSSHSFDAAIIFTNGQESPYPLAYVCYLAGIPIRLGQSQEFGGSVLSQWVPPLTDNPVDRHLFLIDLALKCTHTFSHSPNSELRTPNSALSQP